MLYTGDRWGQITSNDYYRSTEDLFHSIMRHFRIPKRIPLEFYRYVLSENDLVVVILEHIDYLLKSCGRSSPYGYAAYSISKLETPIALMRNNLRELTGIGETTERLVQEILDTGNCAYYEKLLRYNKM